MGMDGHTNASQFVCEAFLCNYSGGLSMTSFFNTNLSNLSNFAERLPEGTIRFVLCTNLANDSNAMRTANLVSIRVIRGGKKLTHSIALDKFVRFVFKNHSHIQAT